MKYLLKIVIVIIVISFSSCRDEKEVFTKYEDVSGETWSWDNPYSFEFEITDSTVTHDFYINLRLTENYPKSNIYLQGQLINPKGDTTNQLYNILLFNNEGASLGKKSGKLLNYKELISKNNAWVNGKYIITLTQFTREFDLSGVNALGIDIIKGEPVF